MLGSRPDIDTYFIEMARHAARRATCARRKVGCILVDEYNNVLATGYNGPASGRPHCIDRPCPGANCPSGTGLHLCEAIHAEINALLQCSDIRKIRTCYSVASPCINCLRPLLNTSCRRIVFAEQYPHSESRDVWISAGRDWVHWTPPIPLPPIGFNGTSTGDLGFGEAYIG